MKEENQNNDDSFTFKFNKDKKKFEMNCPSKVALVIVLSVVGLVVFVLSLGYFAAKEIGMEVIFQALV